MFPLTIGKLVVLLCMCSLIVLSYTTKQTKQTVGRQRMLTELGAQNPGTSVHSTSSMSRTPGCTFLHGSPVNSQDLPDAGPWSTVLALKQGKYTGEDQSNETKQINKNAIKWVVASPLPPPDLRSSCEIKSSAPPAILKFFCFFLPARGNSEHFSWHGFTPYPLLDLLWRCFGMMHLLRVSTGSGYHKLDFPLCCALFFSGDVIPSVMLSFLGRHHKDHNSHKEHTSCSPAALRKCMVLLMPTRPSSECVFICAVFCIGLPKLIWSILNGGRMTC